MWRVSVLCVVVVAFAAGCSSSSSSHAASGKLGASVKLDSGADNVPAGATRTDFDKIVKAIDAKESLAGLIRTGQAINVGKCTAATLIDTAAGGERQVRITDDPQFSDNNGKAVWVDVNWMKSQCTTPSGAAKGAAVSAACDQAMRTIVAESPDVSDAQSTADDDASLTTCTSKTEWLAAAQKYRSSGIDHCVVCANSTADEVLNAFCSGADKPACK
jgi:hypothetical protein